MALHFTANSLQDENGKVFLISYRRLLEECLKHPFNTTSISVIVFETTANMTGEKVIKSRYNQTKLYRWLERRIQEDPKYIACKLKRVEENVGKLADGIRERKKESDSQSINYSLEQIERAKTRKNIR